MLRLVRRLLARVFTRSGNLLGPDLLAEVTVHLTVEGTRKAIISKLDDEPGFATRQKVVQALLFTAMEMAKERAIGINWQQLHALYPYNPPKEGA